MKKVKVRINVKEKSVCEFLNNNMVNVGGSIVDDEFNTRKGVNVYSQMRDRMYFKKGLIVDIGDEVVFELFDSSQRTGAELINRYIYKANEYDDISIEMVLIDFKVELAKKV